jgi:beta-glucanase (GH16 family)
MKFISKKFTLFIFLLIAQIASCQNAKLKLVWSDEFNYRGLPKSEKWNYEHGFVRNKEAQYYTKTRKENAFVHHGYLEIKAIKEQIPNEFYQKESSNWKKSDSLTNFTSASITTRDIASWQYGRVEVRAKLPKGLGVWPAIWMLGTDKKVGWPKCGEIDIMEYVGFMPDKIHATTHYAKNEKGEHTQSGGTITIPTKDDNFHIYAVEWTKETISFYYDDQNYYQFEIKEAEINGKQPFNKPFYLILNLALGGSWGGKIDENNLPQSFLIDYVRVYQN